MKESCLRWIKCFPEEIHMSRFNKWTNSVLQLFASNLPMKLKFSKTLKPFNNIYRSQYQFVMFLESFLVPWKLTEGVRIYLVTSSEFVLTKKNHFQICKNVHFMQGYFYPSEDLNLQKKTNRWLRYSTSSWILWNNQMMFKNM